MSLHFIDITSWMNTPGSLTYAQQFYSMVTDLSGNVTFAQNPSPWFVEQSANRHADVATDEGE